MRKLTIINIVYFFVSMSSFSYAFMEKPSDDFTIEYVGLKAENSSPTTHVEKRSSGHLKKVLSKAIENNDIANVAAVYFLARFYQEQEAIGASITGACGGAMMAIAPITFGISAIAGVPSLALCTWSSYQAHQYRKLKRRAKAHLHLTVYSALVQKILDFTRRPDTSLRGLKDMLGKEGIRIDTMIN